MHISTYRPAVRGHCMQEKERKYLIQHKPNSEQSAKANQVTSRQTRQWI